MRSSRTWLLLAVAALALPMGACSGAAPKVPSSTPAYQATSPAPTVIADGLIVSDAWVRPPLGPDRPGAGYLTIANTMGSDDTLLGVSTPVAASVEMHATVADDSGMLGMTPIDRIDIPVGQVVRFEPGGYHLMLMGVAGMPAVGGTIELTLTFEHGGDIVVQADVRAG